LQKAKNGYIKEIQRVHLPYDFQGAREDSANVFLVDLQVKVKYVTILQEKSSSHIIIQTMNLLPFWSWNHFFEVCRIRDIPRDRELTVVKRVGRRKSDFHTLSHFPYASYM